MKPKILLEHQLPSSVPHHRRRHSSNTYLGLSAQKRQRALTIAGVSLVLLFLLAISRAGHHTREDGVRAGDDYVPVRAQGGMGLFGGRQRQADVQGEYDPSGVREEDDPDYAPKKLTGDEYEEEFGLIEPNEQVFEPPPAPDTPDYLSPEALRRQLQTLTYLLADDGIFPTSRADLNLSRELTLDYLAEVGSNFVAPKEDLDWQEYIETNYPLVVFSKSYCPYSKKAKVLLQSVKPLEPAFVTEVDLRPDADTIKYLLTHLTGRSTFPNVILDFKPLGGGDDIELLHAEGGLVKVLKEGGVKFGKVRLGPW